MRAGAAIVIIMGAGAWLGCAGVIGISDIHVNEGPDATAPVKDAGGKVLGDTGTTPIDEPDGDATTATTGNRVFVTSTTTQGVITDADGICATAAKALGGKWLAWFTSHQLGSAQNRFTSDGPWFRLDGKRVAASRDQLTSGTLDNPISLNEQNQPVGTGSFAWTGANADGAPSPDTCVDWTSNSSVSFGNVGATDATDPSWTQSDTISGPFFQPCNTAAHIYCFEQ
jgi:hypothetical protein